jgi:hypothetical protein
MKGMSVEVKPTDWLSYPTENIKEETEMMHRQGLIGNRSNLPAVLRSNNRGVERTGEWGAKRIISVDYTRAEQGGTVQ